MRGIKLNQRKVFPQLLAKIYSEKITKQALSLIDNHQCISCYISVKDEINTRLLINHLFDESKQVCCPVIVNQQLEMHLLTDLADVNLVQFDLLEPKSKMVCEPTLIFVPLISFNHQGFRIGYGKGYYDRYLQGRNSLKIGLAYSWMLEDFEADKHDIALDYVITEKEIICFT